MSPRMRVTETSNDVQNNNSINHLKRKSTYDIENELAITEEKFEEDRVEENSLDNSVNEENEERNNKK